MNNMNTFAVIGLGRFGHEIAIRLSAEGRDVIAIDINDDLVNSTADYVTRAAVADAKNRSVLQSLGVGKCDCCIVAIGSDLESSVLITMNLKSLGVKYIIAKANNETHREILEKLGADEVIIPEHEGAARIARNLVSSNILEYIELSSNYSIAERETPKAWEGKTILEANIRAKYGINVIAIRRGKQISISPGAHEHLEDGDVLVLLGTNEDLKKIDRLRS